MSIDNLKIFLDKLDNLQMSIPETARLFVWLLTDAQGVPECTVEDVNSVFRLADLHVPNQPYLRRILRDSGGIVPGSQVGTFRSHRGAIKELRQKYPEICNKAKEPIQVLKEVVTVTPTQFLNTVDIEIAYRMAQVYVAVHCLETSARSLVRKTLESAIGEGWWDSTAPAEMKRKVAERRAKEAKNKWLASRGADELNYVDWGDLLTLVRKHEDLFSKQVGDIKVVLSRLVELESLRNVIAHSGVLPDEEIARIELYFRDWCKQLSIK